MAETYALRDDVAWVETGEPAYVVLARVPDGPPLVLHDSSALIWRTVVEAGDPDEVVRRVAEATGETEETVRPGVTAFLTDLASRGLLQSSSSDSR